MPIYRMQCQIAADTTLPRDYCVITPHFEDTGLGSDPQGLCEDLAAGLSAAWPSREIRVTSYDAQGTPPVFPNGTAVENEGDSPAASAPRELAVCLSFYADRNLPRQRGRLYIPHFLYNSTYSATGRPSSGERTAIADDLVELFADLGGVDVDWVVYSRTDDEARKVSNWWIDDEWDVQRSRGLRATERTSGTTSG